MDRDPNADEAAAIAAAIERFEAETAPAEEDRRQAVGPWQRAALIEGVGAKRTIQDVKDEGGGLEWPS